MQAAPEAENKEKEGPLKRLGGKGGLGNDGKGSFYEGRDRLTGRASLRRRTMEKTVLRENVCKYCCLFNIVQYILLELTPACKFCFCSELIYSFSFHSFIN